MTPLSSLEIAAIEATLKGPEAWREELRRQVPNLVVVSRELTGGGAYVNLSNEGVVPAKNLPPSVDRMPLEVVARHPDVDGDIFFLLWIKSGKIAVLEIASGTASLPDAGHMTFRSR